MYTKKNRYQARVLQSFHFILFFLCSSLHRKVYPPRHCIICIFVSAVICICCFKLTQNPPFWSFCKRTQILFQCFDSRLSSQGLYSEIQVFLQMCLSFIYATLQLIFKVIFHKMTILLHSNHLHTTSRPRWSQGNVLASRSEIRGFKSGWGRWIISGRKNPEHKSFGRDFKLGVPSLRFQAR